MSIINTYGFDFDGATYIGFYKNQDLNPYNTAYRLKVKYEEDGSDLACIVNTSSSAKESTLGLELHFGPSRYLSIRFGGNYKTNIISNNQYNIGDELDIVISTREHDTITDIIIVDVSINGEDQRNDTINYYGEDFKIHGTSFDYYFGVYSYYAGKTLKKYSKSILSNFIIETNGEKVFEETFNNTTLGAITGTEQYAVISTEYIPGILIEKIQNYSFIGGSDESIYSDWFFGGTIDLIISTGDSKVVSIYGYNDKSDSIEFLDQKSISGGTSSLSFAFSNIYYRSLIIKVVTAQNTVSMTLTITDRLERLENTETVQSSSIKVDNKVLYDLLSFGSKSITFRVPKSKKETIRTLLQKKVYLDGVEYSITSLSAFDEFGLNDFIVGVSVLEIINV